MIRPPFIALAAVALMLVTSASGLAASSSETEFDCQRLADSPKPDSPVDWLAQSLQAGHCYIFQARAVRISADGVRTLALSHDIRDGVMREVASYLDGPPVVHERHGRIGRGGLVEAVRSESAAASAVMSRIQKNYRLTLDGEERVAGRRSIRLGIEPLDSLRYGHRLWLDVETGLPLKQVLMDAGGHILETFQMTELVEPILYEQTVTFEPRHDMPQGPWRPGWLPPGYVSLPLSIPSGVADTPLNHRLYSDGLSSLSLFVEPVPNGQTTLLPGLHRLGISHAVVRHLRLGERIMQVVVMGELPPEVLRRVALHLQYQPAQAEETTP